MKYAIIAAGEGSRLASEGVALPKPLVPLCGEPMIDRLIRIFLRHQAEEIIIIINQQHTENQQYLYQLAATHPEWGLRIVVQSTLSSMHSFAALSPYLEGAPFVLTTVDTVFREDDFSHYIKAFHTALSEGKTGLMAVTDHIDDERPLYIDTDSNMRILGFHDESHSRFRFISGGIYALAPQALCTLHRCMNEGQSRMRNFQRGLIADGCTLEAFCFSKILDVDHASDIAKAEAFLQNILP